MELVVVILLTLVGTQWTGDVITLEDALRIGLSQSDELVAAEARVDEARAEEDRARSELLPQINGIVSYNRTLASEFQRVFRNTTDLEELPFGRTNVWLASVSLQQNIFTGGRIAARRALARDGRKEAALNLRTTEGQVALAVAEAFYDAALGDRLVTVAELTLEQAEATVRQTELAFSVGTQPEFEALRARVSRDNQVPIVHRTQMLRDIAYLRLKQKLDIPADQPISLSVTLDSELLQAPEPFTSRFAVVEEHFTQPGGVATLERTAVRAAEMQVAQFEEALRAVEAEGRPQISAAVDYAKVAYPTGIVTGWSNPRTNWIAGVTMNIPIFTGGRQSADEAAARAQLTAQRAQYDLTRELADLESRSVWIEVATAHANWQATDASVKFARRAYQIAEIRFQAGVSTQLELSDARLQLQQSEANRATAGRNLQVARVKAALLPDLPVSPQQGRVF